MADGACDGNPVHQKNLLLLLGKFTQKIEVDHTFRDMTDDDLRNETELLLNRMRDADEIEPDQQDTEA